MEYVWEKWEIHTKLQSENFKDGEDGDHLGDQGKEGRALLKFTLK